MAALAEKPVIKTAVFALKINDYVVIKGCPVKLIEYRLTVPGKHGHKKAILKGTNLLNGQKIEDSLSGGFIWSFHPKFINGNIIDVNMKQKSIKILLDDYNTKTIDCDNNDILEKGNNDNDEMNILVGDVPKIDNWKYEHFAMGHGTGKGYSLEQDIIETISICIES